MTSRLTSRRSPLTNDQCLQVSIGPEPNEVFLKIQQVWTLYESGKTRKDIAQQLRLDPRQVSTAIKRGHMPRKSSGRPPSLTSDQVDELEDFICSCRESRQMTYLELAVGPFKEWGVSEQVIRNNLLKRGYSRHRAVSKPRLTEVTRNKRKQWAQAHCSWSMDDWSKILWTDETWQHDGRFTSIFVTRTVKLIKFLRKASTC